MAFRLIAFCNVVRDGFKHHHDCATALVCLHFFLHEDFKIAPSFEYNDGANDSGRDFAVFRSGFLGNNVDVIFGECKTAETFAHASANVTPATLPDLQQKVSPPTCGRATTVPISGG